MFCRSLFVLFLLAIVLSVLRFTDSDYPFGIFKLFLVVFQLYHGVSGVCSKMITKEYAKSMLGGYIMYFYHIANTFKSFIFKLRMSNR
jgi:ABC-type Co2+ transport system permease subunit